MKTPRPILMISLLLAIAGTASSVVFFQKARKAEVAAEENISVVNDLKKEVKTLQVRKATTQNIPVPAVEEGIIVDHDETIRSLEERLRAKDEQIAMLHGRLALMDSSNTNVPPRRDEGRSWMEDLKESDPERYKEITERRDAARQAAKYEVAKKAAHFLDRDTSGMTEDEANQYADMMNLLTDTLSLTEKLEAELPGDERREIMHQFRDNLRALSPMLDEERGREFFQIGKDMGYSDADATAFAAYLTDVVDLTSVGSIFRNSMRAMGGGWGGWGRGGDDRGGEQRGGGQ